MERMGIAELATSGVTEVSGGQLQRAGICRALINDPGIVFADEPTGALNSATALQILDLLGEIHASGTTLVMVTHDTQVAARATASWSSWTGRSQRTCSWANMRRLKDPHAWRRSPRPSSATACDGVGSVASAAATATARGGGGDIAQAQQVTGLVPGGDALRCSRSQGRRHR